MSGEIITGPCPNECEKGKLFIAGDWVDCDICNFFGTNHTGERSIEMPIDEDIQELELGA